MIPKPRTARDPAAATPAEPAVSGAIVSRLALLAGRKCAGAALASLLRTVAEAKPGHDVIMCDDMFTCFVTVSVETGGTVQLRAWWTVDDVLRRRIIVKVRRA